MRIRALRTGVVRERKGTRGISRYLWAGWRDAALPVNAFLIDHPAGYCLFDSGQDMRAATRGYFPRWHPFFRLARFELEAEDEVEAQLAAFGIEPRDLRWIVLSHLHTDHVGGLAPFRESEVVVARTEWARSQGLSGRIRGYLPQHWPQGLKPRLLDLPADGFGPFPGSHDLAGDGRLLIVATGGHTHGHVSLLVRRPEGDVLLGGDLAHTADDLEQLAPQIAAYCAENGITYVGAHDWDAEAAVEARETDRAHLS